jgi:hypothetical protein
MFDHLPHDSIEDGTDAIADHIAAEAVRFKKRSAAAHERIEDCEAGEIVGGIKRIPKRFV